MQLAHGSLSRFRSRFKPALPVISIVYHANFSSKSAESLANEFIVPTYSKSGVRGEEGLVLSHGTGATLYDTRGRKYVDLSAGIAVSVLGHGNQDVAKAVSDQMSKLIHASNLYHTQPPLVVAQKLIKLSPGFDKVFFCNSGTEANEGALKFAKIYTNSTSKKERNRIIAFKGSFHGRTLGALSVTYKPKIRTQFSGLTIPTVTHLDLNDIPALEKAFAQFKDQIMGVIVEPVQGEGGINPAQRPFMKKLRQLCDENDAMLMFDEVQIGLARIGNGKIWGYEIYDNVVPDILTCAKPLAAGLPMGAVLLSKDYMMKLNKNSPADPFLGAHGTTFGGNPVCCRAAEVVLDKIATPGFLQDVASKGDFFISKLQALQKKYPALIEKVNTPLDGKALYAGLKCTVPVDMVIKRALEHGVMVISAGDYNDIIRICPPLVITKDELSFGIDILDRVFNEISTAKKELVVKSNGAGVAKDFVNLEAYRGYVTQNSVLPAGFLVNTAKLTFFPEELGGEKNGKPYHMKLNLVKLEKASDAYAIMFTKNKFPGAPIKVGKKIKASKKPISAIIVNNRISNVHPKGGGVAESEKLCEEVKKAFNLDENSAVFPSSTGIIGWRLPVKEMVEAVPKAAGGLGSTLDHALGFAEGIMTTDNYPKSHTVEIKVGNNVIGRITGFAKGAGMIEPNLGLATMLVFIFTDIDPSSFGFKNSFDGHLEKAVNEPGSFNRISVDSDQSTSDTLLLLSSKASKLANFPDMVGLRYLGGEIEDQFSKALTEVCQELAHHVIRNGEGVEHVMKINVNNCWDKNLAHVIGKRIVNSPLVKTAVAGNDPNVGRLVAAIGNALATVEVDPKVLQGLEIKIGDIEVFKNAEFTLDSEKEARVTKYFINASQKMHSPEKKFPQHERSVEVTVDFKAGNESTIVWGADLTHGYVEENAGYRS